ncbi:MAG: hypothetical protein Q8P31_13575 [Bacillota bacterium]|nr:hypothetical protein [Bacillota bacterium]
MTPGRGGRREHHDPINIDQELGELQEYLVRLQDEVTDVKVRLTELRTHRRLER